MKKPTLSKLVPSVTAVMNESFLIRKEKMEEKRLAETKIRGGTTCRK